MYTGAGLASAFGAGVENRQLRLLWSAVLASLVLHALILYFLPYFKEFRQARAPLPPLTAHLAKPEPPKRAPPEPPKAEPPPSRLPAARPAVKPPPSPLASTVVTAPPVLSIEPAIQPPAETARVLPVGPLQSVVPQPAARAEAPPASAASGPDAGTVARFRLELMEIARRYKRYPRIAQDNNWEGRVELRIAFAESGAISSISVKKGTGRAVLDEEAQAMIRSAQPQVTMPPALRGKAFVLEIPVDFFLKEER